MTDSVTFPRHTSEASRVLREVARILGRRCARRLLDDATQDSQRPLPGSPEDTQEA